MSSHCSQGSAASTSDSKEPGCESSDNAKQTGLPDESSPVTGPKCPVTRTSPDSTPNGSRPMKYQPLRKLTEEQVAEAIAMYQSGLSLAKVAEPFGVSRQSMHDLLKRRIKLRDRIEALPRLTDADRSKVQEKRNRALKRYRSKAKRITGAQVTAVKERDKVCVKCRAPGVDIDHILPVSAGGETELENLQLLCKPCHIQKTRDDWNGGVIAREATQSTSFAEAFRSCAKTSQSQESEPALPGKEVASSMKQHESQTLFSGMEGGSSLRTYPDFLAPMEELTSGSYSRRWPASGFTTSPGELWTADTSECHSGGGEYSSLPDVLEATVPERFYLSQKAAAGILRRAAKRGRELPAALESALRELAETGPASGDGRSAPKMPPAASSSQEAA
jgi:5-methylcytosine-specific restriction endonuclease McrA